MNIIKKAPMIITLITAIIVFSSMGNTVFAKESGRRHHGPPPKPTPPAKENLWGIRPSSKTHVGICAAASIPRSGRPWSDRPCRAVSPVISLT